MSKIDELRAKRNNLQSRTDETFAEADKIQQESLRVADVAHNASSIIKNLDDEFESQTKLRGKDIGFLFFATALQCIRQYFITDFKERLGDQEAAKNTKGHIKEHSSRRHRFYNPSLEEIITNPVPFDTTFGAPDIGSDIAKHGGHRYTTLGHDPILGWIFGTANIATSTLTDYNFFSYHILTGQNKSGNNIDKLTYHADTSKVLSYTFDKLLNEGKEGKLKVSSSLVKEAIHLKSDIGTKDSLSFPFISVIFSPKLASTLADYGLDMANAITVSKQATLAIAINTIIAMIHRLTFNPETDGSTELFEVRTHKVITYSNVIASASNVIAVAIGAAIGAATNNPDLIKKSVQKADIGGLLVTIYRLLNDANFIAQVKQEFILNNFDKMIQGDM